MRRPNSTNRAKTDRVARERGRRTHVGSSTAQPRSEERREGKSQTKDNMKTMSQYTTYRQGEGQTAQIERKRTAWREREVGAHTWDHPPHSLATKYAYTRRDRRNTT